MKTFSQFLKEDTLTKTERTLLDRAKAHPHGLVSVTSELGVTSRGGYHKGAREKTAFFNLIRKGHLEHLPGGSESARERTRDKKRREKSFHTVTGKLKQKDTSTQD